MPALINGESNTASRRFKQIRLCELINREKASVFFFVDGTTGRYRSLLVDRCKTKRAMNTLFLFDNWPGKLFFPEQFAFFCARILPCFARLREIGSAWIGCFVFSRQIELCPFAASCTFDNQTGYILTVDTLAYDNHSAGGLII